MKIIFEKAEVEAIIAKQTQAIYPDKKVTAEVLGYDQQVRVTVEEKEVTP